MMNRLLLKTVLLATLVAASCAIDGVCRTVSADDNVFMVAGQPKSKVSGKITAVSPLTVTVDTGRGAEEIPVSVIRVIEFEGEPRPLARARAQLKDGQFANCLAEIARIEETPSSQVVVQEIEFIRAYANALSSLEGSGASAQDAGTALSGFLRANSNTWHYVPCTEALGRLFVAVGRLDLAKDEFTKLIRSNWPEYILKSHYQLGRIALIENDIEGAKASFSALRDAAGTGETGRTMKLVAECQIAAANGLAGDLADAEQTIYEIIKNEDHANQLLFATAYNSLGMAYEKAGERKKARNAYLHTELLFGGEKDLHAESLYRLSQLWPDLGEQERANRARSTLLGRYPNSYWTSKL